MGLDYVDIFYSHRPDPDTPLEEPMGALDTAVRKGKALYAGISSYRPEQAAAAFKVLRGLGTPCLIHQPSYSMLNRWIEGGLLDLLGREGVGCMAFCPLAQGLLSDKYLNGIPADSRAGRASGFLRPKDITAERLERIRGLQELARARGQTLSQMSLAWVLRDPRVTCALTGASRVSQIEENVAALKNRAFSPGEIARIDALAPA